MRRQLGRSELNKFVATLAPTRIGLEACGASHHWARVLRGLGHEVVLLPPQYIKPGACPGEGRGQARQERRDAAAICEAMSRPGMRFVAVKSAENQAALMLLGVRDLLVKERTMLINAMRGHAAEFGVIAAQGRGKLAELLQRAHVEEAGVPALALLRMLSEQLDALEAELMALATQPGIGPIGAVSFSLKVPDPKAFGSGRHFAAWLGITPKENSSGGRHRQCRISRQGDEGLRRLLVLGATAVIRFAKAGRASPPAFAGAGSG